MNKKYKIFSVIGVISILFAGGCQTSKGELNTEINQVREIQNVNMKVTGVKIIKDDNISDNEKLIQVKFDIQNNNKEEFGIGAGDFYIKDKDEKHYENYGREDSFGDVIATKESLKGNGYYTVPKEAKDLVVIYNPVMGKVKDQKKIKWDIGNPTK